MKTENSNCVDPGCTCPLSTTCNSSSLQSQSQYKKARKKIQELVKTKAISRLEEFSKFRGCFFRIKSMTSMNNLGESNPCGASTLRNFPTYPCKHLRSHTSTGILSTATEEFRIKTTCEPLFPSARRSLSRAQGLVLVSKLHTGLSFVLVSKLPEPQLFLGMLINNPSLLISCCPFLPHFVLCKTEKYYHPYKHPS